MTPTKLTEDLIERAVELKRGHLPVSWVAPMLGIARDTWYRWMRDGENARSGLRRRFYLRMQQAQAEEQLELLGHVQRSAEKGTLGAATWILERQYPRDWGRLDQASVEPGSDGPLEVILNVPPTAVIPIPEAIDGNEAPRN